MSRLVSKLVKGHPKPVGEHARQSRDSGPHDPGTTAYGVPTTTYYLPAASDALDALDRADGGDAACEALQLVEAVDGHREVSVELVRLGLGLGLDMVGVGVGVGIGVGVGVGVGVSAACTWKCGVCMAAKR